VGAYNLPRNVVKEKAEVVGRFALTDFGRGDYILTSKVTENPLAEFEYLSSLDGENLAMSVTIKSFASGLSGKLEPGDIVSLIEVIGGEESAILREELKYVFVLALTSETGEDKELSSKTRSVEDLPRTITVRVNPEQAALLASIESRGYVHAALVYRGKVTEANNYLALQRAYFSPEEVAPETIPLADTPAVPADTPVATAEIPPTTEISANPEPGV
jgi:pilus assembly protein CpaB